MSEFTPAQLDAMEDALEELEDAGVPAFLLESEDAGDMVAAARLGQFREILALSRGAFPLEDVPAGVLDGVLAEARASADADAVAVPTQQPTAEPWWKRLRAVLLVPALAVAGSTALILWMVTPKGADEEAMVATADKAVVKQPPAPAAGEPAAASEVADGRLADAEARRTADAQDPFGGAIARGNAIDGNGDLARQRLRERGEDPAPPPPSPPAEEEADMDSDETIVYRESPPANGPASTATPRRSKSSSGKRSGGTSPLQPTVPPADNKPKSKPKPAPVAPAKAEPVPEPAPGASKGGKKDVGPAPWKLLAESDAMRRKGSCTTARSGYRQVERSGEREARARALAGLGLCEDLAGNTAAADSYYRRARALDANVAKFIEAERPKRDNATSQQAAPPQKKTKE